MNIAGSSNGRTPGFGPGYLGSSPSPAAMEQENNLKSSFLLSQNIEKQLIGLFGNRWVKLDDEKKKVLKIKLLSIFNNPNFDAEITKINHTIETNTELTWNVALLILGAIIGISGNLVANIIERYLKDLKYYEIITTIAFFVACIIIYFLFYFYKKNKYKKVITNSTGKDFHEVLDILYKESS